MLSGEHLSNDCSRFFLGMFKQTPESAMTSVQFVLVDLYPVSSNAVHHSVSETVFTTRDKTRIRYVKVDILSNNNNVNNSKETISATDTTAL